MNRKASEKPCLSCKIISISCLLGIGAYMFSLARKSNSKMTYNIIGTGAIGLGIGQVFDWSPFRRNS